MTALTPLEPSTAKLLEQCDCERTAIRFRTRRNGVVACVRQCLVCGAEKCSVGKRDPGYQLLAEKQPFDEDLRNRWYQQRQTQLREHFAAADARAAEREKERREYYESYLLSSAWRARRKLVLERDEYMCQACRKAQATQVHHLSYRFLGNEPLFDLVAICEACHKALHQKAEQ